MCATRSGIHASTAHLGDAAAAFAAQLLNSPAALQRAGHEWAEALRQGDEGSIKSSSLSAAGGVGRHGCQDGDSHTLVEQRPRHGSSAGVAGTAAFPAVNRYPPRRR